MNQGYFYAVNLILMKFHLIAFFFLLGLKAEAQLKPLSIEDAVLKQRSKLAPARLAQLQWLPASSKFSYVGSGTASDVLLVGSVQDTLMQEFVSLGSLNEKLRSAGVDTLSAFPAVKWQDSSSFTFSSGKKSWLFNRKAQSLSLKDSVTLPENAEVREEGPAGTIAYVVDDNIWIESNHVRKQVTTDGKYELVYGKTVHREEFGISKGMFWSPKGTHLAFYRMDQSMVTDYPIVDFSARPAAEKKIKYPFSGQKSHEVTIGVYDLSKDTIIYLNTGQPAEQYLTNVAWHPSGKYIYVAIVNREQNHMWLNQYDAVSGAYMKTLFEEMDDRYTEPLHPLEFVRGSENLFLWQSRRDGWNHLYLYNDDGILIRQLTRGDWEVTSFNGFDPKGRRAFFHITGNEGIDRQFCSVELSTAKLTRLTSSSGVHAAVLNDDCSFFMDYFSNASTPRITSLRASNGKPVRDLLVSPDPLKEYATGTTRLFQIKAADNTTSLWCRMILPPDFDSTKKYPVIVYVYGGPHAQMITNSWLGAADLWFHHLAAEGYIVFTLDNRGSANRGKAFEQVIHRQAGEEEIRDQLKGVDYLKSLPYVDAQRIGVNGWSYGGFMATSLMTRHPGVFKAAVAGGPVIDWTAYEVMYTERYMDTPGENPEGYKRNNLLNYIDKLQGRLMLIHGTDDDVVVWQHSIMYVKQAVSKGVLVDYMVYPGHPHNVSGRDRVHLNKKITRYFDDFLK